MIVFILIVLAAGALVAKFAPADLLSMLLGTAIAAFVAFFVLPALTAARH
jgi:uncharacterized membrane protein YccC